ncbi:MAG: hypothetical protein JW750_08065 [Anaerolineaceae bacterium]|nr:hypothetical protein [Anaerolineaceae bacterium]
MKPMKPRERVLAALERKPLDRIPYVEHLVDTRVALMTASEEKQLEMITNVINSAGLGDQFKAEDLLQMVLHPSEQIGPNEMGMLFHLMGLAEPEISRHLGRDNITFWGAAACFEEGTYLLNPDTPELGSSADGILKRMEDVSKMHFRQIEPIIEQAKMFLQHKGDLAACALIFLGLDPCWHSMGFETFCTSCLLDPNLVAAFLAPITDWYAQVAVELCKLDFDFIWGADDIAYHTAPFFSPRVYRKVLLPHTRKVAEKITKPWIYHSDGNLLPIWEDLTSQGMNAIHPLEAGSMDLRMLKEKYGKGISFVGGVDLNILEAGTPEQTRAITRELIDILGPNSGYLLSTSNSVTPWVRPENLNAMLETLMEYGNYPLAAETD